MLRQLAQPPRQRDEDADQRDVRVAVGHRLRADLDEADHRHERPEVPEPADEDQVRRALPRETERRGRAASRTPPPANDRDAERARRSTDRRRARPPARSVLAEVGQVRHDRVRQPLPERMERVRATAPVGLLRDDVSDARGGRERDQRQLLDDEARPASCGPPAQRPESSSSSTNGSVTSIGFAASPSANATSTPTYRPGLGCAT